MNIKVFKDRKDNKLMLNDIWFDCDLHSYYAGDSKAKIKLSYFLRNYNMPNHSTDNETILFNENFTFYHSIDFDSDRDFYSCIKLRTNKTHKTWSDLKYNDGYSLFKCINFMIDNKYMINDMCKKVTSSNINNLYEKAFKEV